jgi:hypothetical protein
MYNPIEKERQAIISNITKGFIDNDIEKARHGVYADNAENRRLKRVGQEYGSAASNQDAQQDHSNNEGGKDLSSYASKTKTEVLQKVVDSNTSSKELKDAASKELKKRTSTKAKDKEHKKKMNRNDALDESRRYAEKEFKKRFGHEHNIFDDDSNMFYKIIGDKMEELGWGWREEKKEKKAKSNDLSSMVYDICSTLDEYEKDDNSSIKKTDISGKMKKAVAKFGSLKVAKSMVKTFNSPDFNNFETTAGESLFDKREIKDFVLHYFKSYKVEMDDETENYLE